MYDQAQSPRLGQRAPFESTSIRMFSGEEIPEAAWRGQMIYRTDTQRIQVFNGDAWEDVVGGQLGQLTFVGPDEPVANAVGDFWYDSDDGHSLHQWNGSAWVLLAFGSGAIDTDAIGSDELQDDSVGTDHLQDGAVGTVKLEDHAVNSDKIELLAISSAHVADGAINDLKLAAEAVTAAKIATGAVLSAKLADNAVSLAKLAAGAVDNTKLVDGAVDAIKIATGAITETKISDDAITTPKIATGAVTASEVAAGAIIAGKIATDAVTANTIATGAVVAGKIAADAVTANEIAAGTITADEIAANAVTTTQLNANAVTTAKIAAGAVTATEIAANAVTANKLNVVMGGGNMLSNSGFDNTVSYLTGWLTTSAPNVTRVTSTTKGGVAAAQIAATGGDQCIYRDVTGLIPGNKYSFSAWGYGTGAGNLGYIVAHDTTGANLIQGVPVLATAGQWTRLSLTYTANATGAVRIHMYAYSTKTVVWDNVQLEEGDVVTAYNPKADEILPGTINAAMLQAGAIVVGGGGPEIVFQPGYDPSTKATITALSATDANVSSLTTTVGTKASITDLATTDAKANSSTGYAPNPFFDLWPVANTYPDYYTTGSGAPVRETSIVRTTPAALRYNVAAGANTYVQPSTNYLGDSAFVTITADVYLVSGSWDGSGVLCRWRNTGGGNYDAIVDFSSVLSGKGTGAWYRVQQVVPKPTSFSGTFQDILVWPMGGWTGIKAITAKNIIFDQMNARSSTAEEIKAWTAGLWVYPGTTSINGGLLQTGTVIADNIQSGAVLTNNLSVTSTMTVGTASAGGTMQSYNYAGSSSGWQFTKTSFDLKGGTLTVGDPAGERIVVRPDASGGIIDFFCGLANESGGYINPTSVNGVPSLAIAASSTSTYSQKPSITLTAGAGAYGGDFTVLANNFTLRASANQTGVWVTGSTGQVQVDADGGFSVNGSTGGVAPIGSIMMWPTSTAPSGWLLCDGRSTSGYPELAAIVGSFVPDMRGRMPFGAGTYTGVLGTDGQAESNRSLAHTHGMAHTHGINAGGNHSHTAGTLVNSSTSLAQATNTAVAGSANRLTAPDAHSHNISGSTAGVADHDHTGSTLGASTGVSGSNGLPFMGINFIIKT